MVWITSPASLPRVYFFFEADRSPGSFVDLHNYFCVSFAGIELVEAGGGGVVDHLFKTHHLPVVEDQPDFIPHRKGIEHEDDKERDDQESAQVEPAIDRVEVTI